jgi:hypothetical protein
VSDENNAPSSVDLSSAPTNGEISAVDPGVTRIDITGYSIPLFDGAVRVIEPPVPRRDEAAPRLAEIHFLTSNGEIIAVGANRNMLTALNRAIGKVVRVGDEYHGVGKW